MRTLITQDEVQTGVRQMAARICESYGDRPLTVIGVMTGSVVLLADLIRLLEMPLRVGVVQASSYRDGTSRGKLSINAELMPDIKGRDVLLVDDILDTGHTLKELIDRVAGMGASGVRVAVLRRKHGRQEVALEPDFVAFEIPDEFVVGYGLDYQDHYRNLPYVAALEPRDIENHQP